MKQVKVIPWVERYWPLLEKSMQGVARTLPYSPQDFLQDVYEVALISEKISIEKGISVSSAYWKMFRRWKKRATTSIDVNECDEYSDDTFYNIRGSFPDPEEALLQKESLDNNRDKILQEFMECLTQKEKTVLACVAGLTNGKMSYRETASFLGISCGMVAQIVARIKQKAVVFRNIIKPTDGEQSS